MFSTSGLVTGALEDVFKIGSMAPGAMLFDASKQFKVTKPTNLEHCQKLVTHN